MCIRRPKAPVWALALILMVGCASSPDSPSSVLEPVVENEAPAEPVAPQPKPSDKLMQQLSDLGYEGFGMEYESPATLTLLEKVFSAPEAQNLDLKLVYTGGRLQYDASQKSVTIGGTTNLKTILNFLKKSVPKRKGEPPPKPAPNPPASETESSPQ